MLRRQKQRKQRGLKLTVVIFSILAIGYFLAWKLSGTERNFIDLNSGQIKSVSIIGGKENQEILQTDFSNLVAKYKLSGAVTNWKLVSVHTWGLNRMKEPEWQSTKYGKMVVHCKDFFILCKLGNIPESSQEEQLELFLNYMKTSDFNKMTSVITRWQM